MDMVKDSQVSLNWVEAHALAGVDPTAGLIIQNKGVFPILAFISVTQPVGDVSGFRIMPNAMWSVDAGDSVWVKGEGGTSVACIQVAV